MKAVIFYVILLGGVPEERDCPDCETAHDCWEYGAQEMRKDPDITSFLCVAEVPVEQRTQYLQGVRKWQGVSN